MSSSMFYFIGFIDFCKYMLILYLILGTESSTFSVGVPSFSPLSLLFVIFMDRILRRSQV